nr:hypothetical protein CFP56_27965 [Quercus suber]
MSAKYRCNENSLPSDHDIEYGALTLYAYISTNANVNDNHTNYQYSYIEDIKAPNSFFNHVSTPYSSSLCTDLKIHEANMGCTTETALINTNSPHIAVDQHVYM